MHPGYLSAIIIVMALILTASGWKEELAGNASRRGLLLFFGGWIVGSLFTVHAARRWSVNMAVPVLLLAVFFAMMRLKGAANRWNALSAGCLLAVFDVSFMGLQASNPVLIVYSPMMDASLAVGLLAFVLARQAEQQVVAVSIALGAGELLFQTAHGGAGPLTIGSAAFQDAWWLTMAWARGWTELAGRAFGLGRRVLRFWRERRH